VEPTSTGLGPGGPQPIGRGRFLSSKFDKERTWPHPTEPLFKTGVTGITCTKAEAAAPTASGSALAPISWNKEVLRGFFLPPEVEGRLEHNKPGSKRSNPQFRPAHEPRARKPHNLPCPCFARASSLASRP
jgi:hypothetical protein